MAKLYPGMAFTNIKNNWKTYLPYMLSCSLTIALFYIIGSLGANKGISEMWGGDMIASYFRGDLPVLHQQLSREAAPE